MAWRGRHRTTLFTWLALWGALVLLQLRERSAGSALAFASTVTPALAAATHLHFAAFDRYFLARRYAPYAASVAGTVVAFGALLAAAPGLGAGLRWQNHLNVSVVLLVALGLRYARDGIVSQYRLQEVRAARLEAELRSLKAQINPHFLLNTLNNLYALALERSECLPEALLQLAELMRELLASSREGHTRLSREWHFLENYVALERLQLGERATLTLRWAPPREDLAIAPLLLVPLVENAFKHGLSGERARVEVRLEARAGAVRLCVENDRDPPPPGARPGRGGTGLANLRHRLALTYPGRHAREVREDERRYTVRLELTP